ncbi:MAG TPA: hypothetical protein VF042_06915 [Gemmatimonadaceae bacterium]
MTLAPRHRPTGTLRFSDGSRFTARGAAREFGARALTTFYRRMLFLSYQLEGIRIPAYNAAIDARFSILRADEVDAYMAFKPRAIKRETERRISRGDRCFISWIDGRIVDACWTATGNIYVPYMNRTLHVPEGDVYSYDSYTLPEYRGRGLYMARNSFTAITTQSEGFRRSIALVAYENYSAWLILTRSGLKTLGAYHYLRTPMRGIYWETTEPGAALPEMSAANEKSRRVAQPVSIPSET